MWIRKWRVEKTRGATLPTVDLHPLGQSLGTIAETPLQAHPLRTIPKNGDQARAIIPLAPTAGMSSAPAMDNAIELHFKNRIHSERSDRA